MNDFSLKHDPLSGFEGLGSIPLPKLPLSVVSPPLQGLKVFGAYLYPNFPSVSPPLPHLYWAFSISGTGAGWLL